MRDVEFLTCVVCNDHVAVSRIDGRHKYVCHCTHVDGEVDPVDALGGRLLDRWWYFPQNGDVSDAPTGEVRDVFASGDEFRLEHVDYVASAGTIFKPEVNEYGGDVLLVEVDEIPERYFEKWGDVDD